MEKLLLSFLFIYICHYGVFSQHIPESPGITIVPESGKGAWKNYRPAEKYTVKPFGKKDKSYAPQEFTELNFNTPELSSGPLLEKKESDLIYDRMPYFDPASYHQMHVLKPEIKDEMPVR